MIKRWNKEEVKYLIENFNLKSIKTLSIELGRTTQSIRKKAIKLKLNKVSYDKNKLEEIILTSFSYREVLTKLNKSKSGPQYKILRKYINKWNISIEHFDTHYRLKETKKNGIKNFPIEHWLQVGSNIASSSLKEKIYKEGLKERECEICGQGEEWMGQKMSLILDHINGVNDDNRLENLRIVCPNCNATLPTHCRGGNGIVREDIINLELNNSELT